MAGRLAELVRRIVGAGRAHRQARSAGEIAEDAAARYLEARAARILERNVRCRGGEIDLVVDDAGTIAFVEVRMRARASHGGAAASITRAKQRRLIIAAEYWRQGRGQRYRGSPCRFDALVFDGRGEGRVEWLRGAFEAD